MEKNPDKLCSLDELKTSLSNVQDTSCGPDDIKFQLLKHFPYFSIEALLDNLVIYHLPGRLQLACLLTKLNKDQTDMINYLSIDLSSVSAKRLTRSLYIFYRILFTFSQYIKCRFRHYS